MIEVAPVDLARVEIPAPSIATQRKVVDVLDRFDSLAASLADCLPAEIEARNQQYEYYRDRLLDFPRNDNQTRPNWNVATANELERVGIEHTFCITL